MSRYISRVLSRGHGHRDSRLACTRTPCTLAHTHLSLSSRAGEDQRPTRWVSVGDPHPGEAWPQQPWVPGRQPASLPEPTLQPWPWPVYKGEGSQCLFSWGSADAFLAPQGSRQGRGCLDGASRSYLPWKGLESERSPPGVRRGADRLGDHRLSPAPTLILEPWSRPHNRLPLTALFLPAGPASEPGPT